jgi:hypothetical protein
MDGLKTNGQITGPAGEDLSGWFKIVRGSSGRVLRAEFGPPPGSGFGLESVLVKGVPLEAGAQIAQLIRMVLMQKSLTFTCQLRQMLHVFSTVVSAEAQPWPHQI